MKRLALWILPAALFAGEARYARLGEIEGAPEVQLETSAAWRPAGRNLLLRDGAWVRTGAGARAEIELDEGSAFRLDPEGLCELSDYTRLSTGQRVTLISLDRGLAYLTGAATGGDTLVAALPGAQVAFRRGARVRLEAGETWSRIAVLEGAVTFSSPAAELEIREGQLVRVEPANPSRFFLYREIPALESDQWSEARDKALMTASAGHLACPVFGLADLDAAGAWRDTAAWGMVWKPRTAAGWAPFRSGKWLWYAGLGYTWVSSESWGWLPYHYGRWALDQNAGWVWVPGRDAVFSPGDAYWLRGANMAGWGPLAPGEQWDGRGRPQLFLNATTTFAAFVPEMPEIDPAGFTPPKEPLAAAAFTAALPSPALPAAQLEARRPVLRAGSTRVTPRLAGVTFERASDAGTGAGAAGVEGVAVAQSGASHTNTTVVQPPPPPLVVVTPPPEPVEVFYPVPVYTGIVVVNPPERPGSGQRERERGGRRQEPPAAKQPGTAPPAPRTVEPEPRRREAAPPAPPRAEVPQQPKAGSPPPPAKPAASAPVPADAAARRDARLEQQPDPR